MPRSAGRANRFVRSFNKHVLNPVMLLLAGRRHWYAGVIRHTGRKTGAVHRTPVVAVRVPDGFLTPLPYGTDVDWLRNAQAAGRASITVDAEQLPPARFAKSAGCALAVLAIAVMGFVSSTQMDVPGQAVQPFPPTTSTTTTVPFSFHPQIVVTPECGAVPWDGGCG